MTIASILREKGNAVTTVTGDLTIHDVVSLLHEHRIGAFHTQDISQRRAGGIELPRPDVPAEFFTGFDAPHEAAVFEGPIIRRMAVRHGRTRLRTGPPEIVIDRLFPAGEQRGHANAHFRFLQFRQRNSVVAAPGRIHPERPFLRANIRDGLPQIPIPIDPVEGQIQMRIEQQHRTTFHGKSA